MRRLANRLRDSEQINEALRAELGAYKSLYKSHGSPVTPQSPEQQVTLIYICHLILYVSSLHPNLLHCCNMLTFIIVFLPYKIGMKKFPILISICCSDFNLIDKLKINFVRDFIN